MEGISQLNMAASKLDWTTGNKYILSLKSCGAPATPQKLQSSGYAQA